MRISFVELKEFSIEWKMILHQQVKEKINYLVLTFFLILIQIALLCQKKDSYTDSVYSKDALGTILTISQRCNFSQLSFTDLIFYGIDLL